MSATTDDTTDHSADHDTVTTRTLVLTGGWVAILGLVAMRAGFMLGLWPLAVRPDGGLEQANVMALAVHGLGAVAVSCFLLARSKPGVLLGLAYTGYSTIALGLGNPRPGLTAIIWTLGILTLAALVVALVRGGLGRPSRPSRAAILVTAVGMALGAAAATVVALLQF